MEPIFPRLPTVSLSTAEETDTHAMVKGKKTVIGTFNLATPSTKK